MTNHYDRQDAMRAEQRRLRDRLIKLPRTTKQLLMLVADAVGFLGCVGLVAWVQLLNTTQPQALSLLAAGTLVAAHLLARLLGFYHSIVRYLGMGLLTAGAQVGAGSALMLAGLAWLSGMTTMPLRLAVVYGAFCAFYLVGSRYIAQYFLVRKPESIQNVVIYGAGEAGARVVQAMQGNPVFAPVAFVDDDRTMYDKRVCGLLVRAREDLPWLIQKFDVSHVLLAMPSVSRKERREVIESLEPLPVHVQTVPDIDDLISGKARVNDIREVDVEDLLSRAPVAPYGRLLQANLLDKSVLVTGAGGSIGSELCRQILRIRPKTLLLFELSEVALYSIDRELAALAARHGVDCRIVPLLGSVQEEARVKEVMEHFSVDTVYHAAAYKHVPLVEQNLIEGVCNNVLGTLRAARAARDTGVESFVLVSTDKAVSPTSIMGASKRFAELVLQALQEGTDSTRFAMVRFGNVLESSGSVVPLFREQIRQGGPVTVTHPEIIRYFMTIPEAAQLVIQAGGMAQGGEVFVLDMGEPVRIRDLAARMIKLMGLTVKDADHPDGDIEISFTGLRPAEKLYEELLIGENVAGTEHPRIMRAREDYLTRDEINPLLEELQVAARTVDRKGVRDVLLRAVREYKPNNGIDDLLWEEGETAEAPAENNKVITIDAAAASRKKTGSSET